VTVYATVKYMLAPATLSFKLDDEPEDYQQVKKGPKAEFSIPIWKSQDHLEDASHTLEITHHTDFSSRNGSAVVFYLDRLTYTPTPNTPRQGLVYFMDEKDSRIIYTGSWWASQSKSYLGGAGMTSASDENSFQFSFRGA
jgi:hypothetical protein